MAKGLIAACVLALAATVRALRAPRARWELLGAAQAG
jgi:hypothetical protein